MASPEDGNIPAIPEPGLKNSGLMGVHEASRRDDPTLDIEVFRKIARDDPAISELILLQARSRVASGTEVVEASLHDQLGVVWAMRRQNSLRGLEEKFAESPERNDSIVINFPGVRSNLWLVPDLAPDTEPETTDLPAKRGPLEWWRKNRQEREERRTLLKASVGFLAITSAAAAEALANRKPTDNDAA